MCEKHNFERTKKWYEHCTEGAVEDDDVKLIWCDNIVEVRRPNLILVDKKPKSCVIIDVAIPDDIEKYQFEERERERERDRKRERQRERQRQRQS